MPVQGVLSCDESEERQGMELFCTSVPEHFPAQQLEHDENFGREMRGLRNHSKGIRKGGHPSNLHWH